MKRDNGDHMAKLIAGTAIALLLISVILIVFGTFFLGISGIFAILGVQYDSISSLFLFVLLLFLVGIPFEIVERVIIILGKRHMTTRLRQIFWDIIVKIGLNWIVIAIIDAFMTSINISALAGFLTALLFYLVEIALNDLDKEKEEKAK